MLVKPEDVGLSSPRLARIGAHLERYIDAGRLAGALTLVARRGRVAYCEPLLHLERRLQAVGREGHGAPPHAHRIEHCVGDGRGHPGRPTSRPRPRWVWSWVG